MFDRGTTASKTELVLDRLITVAVSWYLIT